MLQLLEEYAIFADEAWAPLREALVELLASPAANDGEARIVLEHVSRFPHASLILLQLLRHQERCNDEDALLAESLAYATLQASSEFRRWLNTREEPATPVNQAGSPLLLTRNGNQLQITLNRPDERNAYSAGMRDALYEALLLLDTDRQIDRCIIEGSGSCFCVGGDLAEFGKAADAATAHAVRSARNVARLMSRNRDRIECRVHRACIGSGIEIPAFASRLLASEETFFQLPELSMGLIPGAGGTVSVLRRIGRKRLAWWILSGKRITARTALAWGLVDTLV